MKSYVDRLLVLLVCSFVVRSSAAVPPGFELVDITRDPDVHHASLGLNNCGQIVYQALVDDSGDNIEVFIYDNGGLTQITDNEGRDVDPGITENGILFWLRGSGERTTQFLSLQGGQEIILDEHSSGISYGVMNSRGQYAISILLNSGCRGVDHVVLYFDGVDTLVLRNGGSSSQLLEMNDRGELVWAEFDFCVEPSESTVMHYYDGVFTSIGDEFDKASAPVINERSQVAYTNRNEGDERSISLWEDGVSRIVIPPETSPGKLNNFGDIAFHRRNPPGGDYIQPWLYEAETEEVQPLLDVEFHQGVGGINDYREILVASREFGTNVQVRFLRRIRTGDSEFDGDIDHDDLAKLVECMTGPMWVERTGPGPEDSLCQCRFLDINHDGSVDLRDYTIFQQHFGE